MNRFIQMVVLMLGFVSIFSSVSWASVENNAPAPDFTLVDVKGAWHKLSDYKGKYVVLEWVNYDCPFVKKHYQSGNMQKTQQDVLAKGGVWLSINSSNIGKQGNYQPKEVVEIMVNSNAQPTAYLLDTDGHVGKTYGAKTTPHMFIINPEGVLIYQGAIDDKPGVDPSEIATAKNYVISAINAAMAGHPVEHAATTSYGCSVKY